MLRDPDLLFGKLALGRGLLAREDALRLARDLDQARRSGRVESLAAAAVRLGYLEPRLAQQLDADLARGALVCRGSCGRSRPAAGASPREAERCPGCGGPVYLSLRAATSLAPAPAPGKTGLTVMELDVPVLSEGGELEEPFSASGVTRALPPGPARRTATGTAVVRPLPARASLGATEPMLAAPLPLPATLATPASGAEGGGADRTVIVGEGGSSVSAAFEPFLLSGGLRVVAPLGRGGTGAVFRGVTAEGRTVAVKILRLVADPEALQRFDREVRISALLDHPQIVRVLETGTVPAEHPDAGKPYCVMEYVEGRDLTAWVAERPRRPAECAALIARLCDPVEHANQKAVIHRDIKPANVLVRSADELPVLCDFGLARYRARDLSLLTEQGDILGTPAFMAPEQARGQPALIGPPTDVHALGAVLYRLVTGRPPFQGPTPFATIDAVARHAPQAPRQLNPEITPALEAVILKALAKDPRERWHTASRLKVALLQAIGA